MIERLAFAGDWHMNPTWARRVIRYAHQQGAEVIVQLGDFGYTYSKEYLDVIEEELARAEMTLYFVDGNHEDFPHLYGYPVHQLGFRPVTDRVAHLPRGYLWEWGGVRFLAMGGGYSVDRKHRVQGLSWWPEETITPRQVNEAATLGPVDVLISHDCPAGVLIPGIDDPDRVLPAWLDPAEVARSTEHRGRLRDLVDQVRPKVVWHGHYHVRHRTVADLGYGPVVVNGLAEDGSSLDANLAVVDVADLLVRS